MTLLETTTEPLLEVVRTSFEQNVDDDFTDFYREKGNTIKCFHMKGQRLVLLM